MNFNQVEFDGCVDELMAVLDDEKCHIQLKLERLTGMKSAVIRRDEKELRALLEISAESISEHDAVEQKRDNIRLKLADMLGKSADEVNLSVLTEKVSQDRRRILVEKQKELREIVEKFRREYVVTTAILRESARFNRKLIKQMMGEQEQTVTYNSNGDTNWRKGKQLLSYRM
jgi:hypothetical protein